MSAYLWGTFWSFIFEIYYFTWCWFCHFRHEFFGVFSEISIFRGGRTFYFDKWHVQIHSYAIPWSLKLFIFRTSIFWFTIFLFFMEILSRLMIMVEFRKRCSHLGFNPLSIIKFVQNRFFIIFFIDIFLFIFFIVTIFVLLRLFQ